jgi:hypothetical protein
MRSSVCWWQIAAGRQLPRTPGLPRTPVLASWRQKNELGLAVAPGNLSQVAGSTPAYADRCFIASNAKRAPRCGVLAAGVDPPNFSGKWPLADRASVRPSLSGVVPESGHASFRALLRDTRQKGANFGLPVPAVTAERPDRRQLSSLCPSGNCLRVNPEHRCDFRWGKQRLSLWCTC